MKNDEIILRQAKKIERLEKEVERLQESERRHREWIHKAKRDAGYNQTVSFDDVWKKALENINK